MQLTLKNIVVNLGNDTIVCGPSLELDAQNGGKTYKWNDGSINQKLSVTKTGKYAVDVKDGSCVTTDDIFITIDIVSLNLGNDIKICQNQASPQTLDAGTASKYSWNTGDSTRKITVNTTGNYSCKITDVLGCTALDTISISYFPAASANFRDSMVAQHTIKFIPDSAQYTSYFWTFDGTSNSSTVSPTQYFAQSGTATVTLKVITKDGCVDSVTKTIYTTPIATTGQDYYLNIFPNPNSGLFAIDLNLLKKSDIIIESYDLSGKKVYESKFFGANSGKQLIQVNMLGMPATTYMMKISIDGNQVLYKLVNIAR